MIPVIPQVECRKQKKNIYLIICHTSKRPQTGFDEQGKQVNFKTYH